MSDENERERRSGSAGKKDEGDPALERQPDDPLVTRRDVLRRLSGYSAAVVGLVGGSSLLRSLTACSSSDTGTSPAEQECAVGTERCECTAGGACDPGLECRSGLCVDPDGQGGASSSGGGSNVGGAEPGAGGSSSGNTLCSDSCELASDAVCQDSGPGATGEACELGTDCADCGPRDAPEGSGGATGSGGRLGAGGRTGSGGAVSYYNTGYYNTGYYNTGYYNTGYYNYYNTPSYYNYFVNSF